MSNMKYLVERNELIKEGDIVWIHYWYNGMPTLVKILEKNKRTYKVTHNNKYSKIFNAPDEKINRSQIIQKYKS